MEHTKSKEVDVYALFLEFLKKQGTYRAFARNLMKQRFDVKTQKEAIKEYKEIADFPSSFISGAFTWMETKEDWKFWHQLSIKWKAYLNRKGLA